MKILFITPHLSTGGAPQYLLKKIKELNDHCEIYCVEYSNVTGGVLVVQRNQIENILKNKLKSLGENKLELLDYINNINPDVIHFEEVPEYFCDKNIAKQIYKKNRLYKIIETSHDSSFDVKNKIFFPDCFIFVSEYQKQLFSSLEIPSYVVEYPIEYKVKTKNRVELLSSLGLDPSLKHIVNVGLFTPRKNQAEIIEYAKKLKDYPIQFHFIGNQADNFKWYWEPLMKDFPPNCKWWNERRDVDTFYEFADLFLFTSRGNENDKETMPLVIREAIGWQIPSLIYNLPVYLNYFDKYKNIKYLEFENLNNNCKKILDILSIENHDMINEQKNYSFWSRWDADQQQMYFGTNENVNFKVLISLKEYSSDAVVWSTKYDSLYKDVEYWISPAPLSFRNYKTDPYISGVKICIYDLNKNEQIYECPYFNKFYNKPNIRLSNSIPYYHNLEEFFVIEKYKTFFNKKYENVVDAGANVGVFIKYILNKKLSKKIVAVECDPDALKDLHKNFEEETKVKIIPKALHTKSDTVEFYHSVDNPVTSASILNNNNDSIEVINVESITLKELIDELGFIDLLKVDIEGSEYDIFSDLKEELLLKINNIFIECHFFKEEYQIKFNELIIKMKKNNFEIIDPFGLTTNFKYNGKSEVILFKKI